MTTDVVIAGVRIHLTDDPLDATLPGAETDLIFTVRGPDELLHRVLARIDPARFAMSSQRELVDEFDTYGTLTR